MLNFIKNLFKPKMLNAAQAWQLAGNNPIDAYWLYAAPVHLVLQRDTFSLGETVPLPLESDEITSLTDALNQHFQADNMQFFWHENHWFLKLNSSPTIQTSLPTLAINQDIAKYLPTGAGAMQWAKFQNELQMLLFAHPVNGVREAKRLPVINSIWCYGGGEILNAKNSHAN